MISCQRDEDLPPYSPRQSFLLPPSPTEWLPEGHLAHFILDVVTQPTFEPYEHFWSALRRVWSRWAEVLVIVNPETVVG